MKYFIKTFGCQMNKSDSERIVAVLEKAGLQKTSEEKADFLIVNICSVRQRAMDRVYALVQKWKKYRGKIILTGCILEKDKKALKDKVNLIIDVKEIQNLPRILRNKKPYTKRNKKQKIKNKKYKEPYLEIKPKYESRFSAYVPIMNGCNNFCSYCVVPYVRGKEYSRPAEKIISEVKNLVKKGYKEIVLLGQNVNSYKCKMQKSKIKMTDQNVKIINFPKLLQKINNIPGNFWIRFLTSHPKDMSEELIEAIASSEKVCEYIHLPLQAGDNTILKKMNRRYTVQKYLNLIKKIQAKIPKVTLSTDIIVGFPGETKRQFENTVRAFKKVKFDMAYIACYSPRPGTAAAKLKDNVSPQEKKRRYTILNQLLRKIAQEKNKKLTGKQLEILVEKYQSGFCFGKTRGFKTVKFKGEGKLVRRFVMVKIQKTTAWGLSSAFLRCLGSGS